MLYRVEDTPTWWFLPCDTVVSTACEEFLEFCCQFSVFF
jgi:hypothetical protein